MTVSNYQETPLTGSDGKGPSIKDRLNKFFQPYVLTPPSTLFEHTYIRFSDEALRKLPAKGDGARVKSRRADRSAGDE
jgi:hypothetical protein